MKKRELLSPADDTASHALVDVQAAITRVKEIITEGVSKAWPDKELTDALNKAISAECKNITNEGFREQFRKSLVVAARKWHYELKQTYRVLDRNFQKQALRQPLNVDLLALTRKTPFEKQVEFRKLLDDGTNPGIPVIKDYQSSVKLAIKALSAEPPKIVTMRNGKAYVMPARLRAEMAVRYSAAVENLQRLQNEGVKWCWISSHANCSPRCKEYQGKLYSLFDGEYELDGRIYKPRGTIDGIPYRPINEALAGPKGDGNGCISGYNCRHRAIEYERGSKAPADFTEAEIKREYAIDKQQRSYENRIRQLKQEEKQLRACGMEKEAKALRKKWRILTKDYQIYSIEHDRAYYPYRYVIDRDEIEEDFKLSSYVNKARKLGNKKQEKLLTNYKNQFIIEQERAREASDFVLAKTVQEAEQYMSRRSSSVSYNGITNIKSLNQANRTFAYLSDKYGINMLDHVSTDISFKNARKGALAEATGRTLHISKNFANNPTMEEVINSTSNWKGYINNRIKTDKENLIKHSENKAFIEKVNRDLRLCDELLKYSRHNVCYENREVESIITHEMGHIIAEQRFQQLSNEYAMGGSAEKVRNVFEKAKECGDIYKISKYASTDSKEFFAECFTMYEIGREKIPDYIQEMMEDVLK